MIIFVPYVFRLPTLEAKWHVAVLRARKYQL
jgi:hypothetical protein